MPVIVVFAPTAVNVNLYNRASQSVGHHSDNESIMARPNGGERVILSLTIGSARAFEIKSIKSDFATQINWEIVTYA